MADETITGAEINDGWYDDDTATFGDRLAGAREASDLTQAGLARRLGVKTNTIRSWENDMSEPRANKLQMLAGVLAVSIMWLLNGKGDGIDAPSETTPLTGDVNSLMKEMRALRVEQNRIAEEMGRLEKRLRLVLAEKG